MAYKVTKPCPGLFLGENKDTMDPGTTLILGIVLALVGILHINGALKFFGKAKTNVIAGWIVMVVGGLFLVGYFAPASLGNTPLNWFTPTQALAAGVPAAGTPGTSVAGVCSGTPLSTTQTPTFTVVNHDQQGTSVTTTATIYGDVTKPSTIVSNTIPGQSYTALLNSTSSFLSVLVPFTTPCNSPTINVPANLAAVDTAVSFATYNSGGHTLNSLSANQSVAASSSVTLDLELTPSALYKHIGGGPSGQFAVFINATNSTNWDTTKFSLSGNTGWGASTPACTPYNGPIPTALANTYVYGWTCTGDFSGFDTAVRTMNLGLGVSAQYTAQGSIPTVSIVPVTYFKNSITGAVQSGPVNDAGAAIIAAQQTPIYLK